MEFDDILKSKEALLKGLKKANKLKLAMYGFAFFSLMAMMISWNGISKKESDIGKGAEDKYKIELDTADSSFRKVDFSIRDTVGNDLKGFSAFEKKENEIDKKDVFEKLGSVEVKEEPSDYNVYRDSKIWGNANDTGDNMSYEKTEDDEDGDPFGFYVNEEVKGDLREVSDNTLYRTFSAEVFGIQEISQKNLTLQIVTTEDMIMNGKVIPANTRAEALATIGSIRVKFTIKAIRLGNQLHRVDISVLDSFGNEGLELTHGQRSNTAEELNNELEGEVNRHINRGNGVLRSVLTAKPRLKLNGNKILLRSNL